MRDKHHYDPEDDPCSDRFEREIEKGDRLRDELRDAGFEMNATKSPTPLTDNCLKDNQGGILGAVGKLLDHGEWLEKMLAEADDDKSRLAEMALQYKQQRDTLAKALRAMKKLHSELWDEGYVANAAIATDKALAAVKGEKP